MRKPGSACTNYLYLMKGLLLVTVKLLGCKYTNLIPLPFSCLLPGFAWQPWGPGCYFHQVWGCREPWWGSAWPRDSGLLGFCQHSRDADWAPAVGCSVLSKWSTNLVMRRLRMNQKKNIRYSGYQAGLRNCRTHPPRDPHRKPSTGWAKPGACHPCLALPRGGRQGWSRPRLSCEHGVKFKSSAQGFWRLPPSTCGHTVHETHRYPALG